MALAEWYRFDQVACEVLFYDCEEHDRSASKELSVPSGNHGGRRSKTERDRQSEPVDQNTKKVEWVVASFHTNHFCGYRQADQIGGWYIWPFHPFPMAMYLPQQYMSLNGVSRSSISSGQMPVPFPNLLYVGHTFQDRRQRQDLMVEDVYYRILRAYAIIRPCKHATIRFATYLGSEIEEKSSLPLCHIHHM